MIDGWPSQWRIDYGRRGEEPVCIWPLAIRPTARLLEIRGIDDWQRLTERFPLLVESEPLVQQPDLVLPAPLYLPDWSAVAREWDGVRVTMGGVLATAFVVAPVLDGFTVLNDQIADERTLWTRWVVESVGAPVTV